MRAWERTPIILSIVCIIVMMPASHHHPHIDPPPDVPSTSEDTLPSDLDDVLLPAGLLCQFTENRGQFGGGAGLLYTRGKAFSAAFERDRVRYTVHGAEGTSSVFEVVLEGANVVVPIGIDPLDHRTDFFRGRDPRGWVTGAVSYREVLFADIYDNVDLVYHYMDGMLKYRFEVAPGGDPSAIRMRYDGVEDLAVDGTSGDLLVGTSSGTLRDLAPLSHQPVPEGTRVVGSSFALLDGRTVGLQLDDHDPLLPLVIDPGLVFSTFIGCSDRDIVQSMYEDGAGNIWLTGVASKNDFPTTPGAYQTDFSGGDAIVVKFNANCSSLLYSTYFGGWHTESGLDLHVDGSGLLYLVGMTASDDFPVTGEAYCDTLRGYTDLFITTLDVVNSRLVHSTYLGGGSTESVGRCAFDGRGLVYLAGGTNSTDFPTTAGSIDSTYGGGRTDAFLTVYNVTDASLEYSTLLGGMGQETVVDIHLDDEANVFMCGSTGSGRFPTTQGAFDTTYDGAYDVFALKLNVSASRLEYSTFLGGPSLDEVYGLAVDGQGCAYVGGNTFNPAFPTTEGAYDRYLDAWSDMFVTRLDVDGSTVLNSTLLGRENPDYGGLVELDEDGGVYVAGFTYSRQFPVTDDALDGTYDAKKDIVLARFDPNLTSLQYATYLGGKDEETPVHLLVGTPGNMLLTGYTRSGEAFPTTPGAYQTDLNGYWEDIFVLRMDIDPPAMEDHSPRNATTGDPFHLNLSVVDNLGVSGVAVEYWFGAGGQHLRRDCTLVSGTASRGTWSHAIAVPKGSLEDLHYKVEARDRAGNTVATDVTFVDVLDDDPPELSPLEVPAEVTTGDPITVSVEVRDNIGVEEVRLIFQYFFFPPYPVYLDMEPLDVDDGGNGTYTATFSPYPHVLMTSLLEFFAMDIQGNRNWTERIEVPVRDDDLPMFVVDSSSANATTGDPFTFSVDVVDNVSLASVWVHYWYGRGRAFNLSLARTEGRARNWNATITIPHAEKDFHYLFGAVDTSGNVNWSSQVDLQVVDDDAPNIVSDNSTVGATTGDPFTFEVRAEDNLLVAGVNITYRFGEGAPTELELTGHDLASGDNGTYRATVTVPSNSTDDLRYAIVVTDGAGNVNATGERRVEVVDDDPPWFGADLSDEEALRGGTFHFDVEVGDNIGVGELWREWWFGEGEHQNSSVPLDATISNEIPLDPEGPLRYLFSARDAAGNWNRTQVFQREVPNRPPTLEAPELWEVVEEEDVELFLADFCEDPDSPWERLSMDCTHPNVTVVGWGLWLRHDVWVPDYEIEVSVTDGESTIWRNVTVRVVPVNDPPVIAQLRKNDRWIDVAHETASLRRGGGSFLSVVVTDEEGDELTYAWLRGERVVATGERVGAGDLPLGSYVLTLVVDDGTDAVACDVPVVVLEEEESSSVWAWALSLVALVVLVLLVAGVARVSRRRGGRHRPR